MAAICSMIFLLIVLGLVVLLVWSVWATLAAIFAKRKLLLILLGLPASALIVALAFAGLWFYTTRPAYVFRREFGFPAPADTVLLDASAMAFGDSGTARLYFRTSPTTLARLTSGFGPDNAYDYPDQSPPASLRLDTRPGVVRLSLASPTFGGKRFANEFRRIIHDPATGETWYFYSGVD